MKLTALQEFNALRESLLSQRKELQERVDAINEALGGASVSVTSVPRIVKHRAKPPLPKRLLKRGRQGHARSLKQLVIEATKSGSKTKQEILEAVQKAGYKFATSNPLNSLGTFLYTSPQIKKDGDKFGPA